MLTTYIRMKNNNMIRVSDLGFDLVCIFQNLLRLRKNPKSQDSTKVYTEW